MREPQERKVDGQDHGQGQVATDVMHGESETPQATFTSLGTIPGVALDHDDRGPSPSDAAFGDVGYDLDEDRDQEQDSAFHFEVNSALPNSTKKKPTFKTLRGTQIEKTSGEEATLLNAIRRHPQRLEPGWLMQAQGHLQIGDNTGAMNTETLRVLLGKLGKTAKQATANDVLDKAFLTGLFAGNPFAAGPATDWHTDPKNAKATRKADKAAQAVGYADYDAYQKTWVKDVTFLDVPLDKGKSEATAHPYLVSRLKAAEDFLINLHGSKEAALKATKWDQQGGLSYEFDDNHVNTGMSHQHTMGLAIDISPGVNPWIYRNSTVKGVDQNQKYDDHFAIAARLFGGPAVTSAKLNDWSRSGSTEELHGNVDSASNHINQYMRFSQKHAKKTETDIQEIRTFMESKGFKPEEATEEKAKFVADFAAWFHGAGGQSGANELTNISMDMLVALRDVAGLSWGGTEMGGAENGDFMHFDCRNTEFGNAVVKQMSPDDQKKAAEAEAAKNAKPKKK